LCAFSLGLLSDIVAHRSVAAKFPSSHHHIITSSLAGEKGGLIFSRPLFLAGQMPHFGFKTEILGIP
jgi:hypothetical protein